MPGVNSSYRTMDLKGEGDTAHVPHDERKGQSEQPNCEDTDVEYVLEYTNTPPNEDAASSGDNQPATGQSLSLKHNQSKQQPSTAVGTQYKQELSATEGYQIVHDQPVPCKETILHIQGEQSTPFSASSMSQCENQAADQESQTENNNDTSLLNRVKGFILYQTLNYKI